jgi:dynein heavy chain
VTCYRFDCECPYDLLDDTHLEIAELEDEMGSIQDSASLFEVNVPDFKHIKQCRKELRMLKVKQLAFVPTLN